MKYAYLTQPNGNIVFTSGENIVFWKELSQTDFDFQMEARKNAKISYEDSHGNLQIRDRDTIWDEATSAWIPDIKAIRDKANNTVIAQAVQAYQAGNLDRHQFSKLTTAQQKELGAYLDTLLEILAIKESVDYEITLPQKLNLLS